jgi:hypothetical protein
VRRRRLDHGDFHMVPRPTGAGTNAIGRQSLT